jgi:hypothetical protein
MKRNISMILLLLFCSFCFGQNDYDKKSIRKSVLRYANSIEKGESVSGKYLGPAAVKPKQYKNFDKLSEKANKDELIELTNHPSPQVRCYAFWALTINFDSEIMNVIRKNQHDTATVTYKYGCLRRNTTAIRFMSHLLDEDYITNLSEEDRTILIKIKN